MNVNISMYSEDYLNELFEDFNDEIFTYIFFRMMIIIIRMIFLRMIFLRMRLSV
jgi:hypothetical protein